MSSITILHFTVQADLLPNVPNVFVEACTEEDLSRPVSKLKEKQEHRRNTFHDLESEEEEMEEIEADEDLESNVVEPATSKKKAQTTGKSGKEEL